MGEAAQVHTCYFPAKGVGIMRYFVVAAAFLLSLGSALAQQGIGKSRAGAGAAVEFEQRVIELRGRGKADADLLLHGLSGDVRPGALSDTATPIAARRFNVIQQVVPPGDEPGTQGSTIRKIVKNSGMKPGAASAAAASVGATATSPCNRQVVEELASAQRGVSALPVDLTDIPPDERLYRLLTGHGSAARETQASRAALKQLEGAWRSMLEKCFSAPSDRPLFSHLAGRIGAFAVPGRAPFCTGTILENGKILTARHCFFDYRDGRLVTQNVQGLVFALADGSSTLEIPATGALSSAGPPFDATRDWIVIDAPQLQNAPARLPRAGALLAFPEAAFAGEQPTALELFSVLPLAGVLDRVRFPKSIVGFSLPGCYATFKQDACLTHMCGVMPGGSGASLFLREAPQPTWAGLHLGPETPEDGSCSGNAELSANMALRGNAEINKHFGE